MLLLLSVDFHLRIFVCTNVSFILFKYQVIVYCKTTNCNGVCRFYCLSQNYRFRTEGYGCSFVEKLNSKIYGQVSLYMGRSLYNIIWTHFSHIWTGFYINTFFPYMDRFLYEHIFSIYGQAFMDRFSTKYTLRAETFVGIKFRVKKRRNY